MRSSFEDSVQPDRWMYRDEQFWMIQNLATASGPGQVRPQRTDHAAGKSQRLTVETLPCLWRSDQQQNHLLVAAQRYGAAVPRPCFSPWVHCSLFRWVIQPSGLLFKLNVAQSFLKRRFLLCACVCCSPKRAGTLLILIFWSLYLSLQ